MRHSLKTLMGGTALYAGSVLGIGGCVSSMSVNAESTKSFSIIDEKEYVRIESSQKTYRITKSIYLYGLQKATAFDYVLATETEGLIRALETADSDCNNLIDEQDVLNIIRSESLRKKLENVRVEAAEHLFAKYPKMTLQERLFLKKTSYLDYLKALKEEARALKEHADKLPIAISTKTR